MYQYYIIKKCQGRQTKEDDNSWCLGGKKKKTTVGVLDFTSYIISDKKNFGDCVKLGLKYTGKALLRIKNPLA